MMMRALCNNKEEYIIFCQEMEEDKSKKPAQDWHIPSRDNSTPCEVRVTRDWSKKPWPPSYEIN